MNRYLQRAKEKRHVGHILQICCTCVMFTVSKLLLRSSHNLHRHLQLGNYSDITVYVTIDTLLEALSDTLMRIHEITLIYELLIQRKDDSVFKSNCCFCREHSLTFQHPHVGQHTRGIETYRYRLEKYHPKIKISKSLH